MHHPLGSSEVPAPAPEKERPVGYLFSVGDSASFPDRKELEAEGRRVRRRPKEAASRMTGVESPQTKAARAAYARRLRRKARKAGACTMCRTKLTPKRRSLYRMCAECQAYRARQRRERYARLRADGVCVRDGCNNRTIEGWAACVECLDRDVDKRMARRAAS